MKNNQSESTRNLKDQPGSSQQQKSKSENAINQKKKESPSGNLNKDKEGEGTRMPGRETRTPVAGEKKDSKKTNL